MWLKKEVLFQLVMPVVNYKAVLIEEKGNPHEYSQYPLH